MTQRQDPGLLDLDHLVCFALYSTTHALNRAYKPVLKALDLTYPQYLAMVVLWQRDGLTVKEIGQKLFLDSGTLTPLLKRLEAMGLITRIRDTADERQVRIALTEKGQALREKARKVPNEVVRFMGRSPEDLTALKNDLARLRDQMNASTDDSIA